MMNFDKRKFMAALKLCGVSVRDVAREIGVSFAALYRKINGESDFYRYEIVAICALLHLDNVKMDDIFFSQKVS